MKLIAFLRGLRLSARAVTMDYLQTAFEAEGFERVEVFLATGNVAFDGDAEDIAGLEHAIDAMLLDALGFDVTTFIRTDAEVRAIAHYKPFMPALVKTAAAYNVAMFRDDLDAAARETVLTFRTPGEELHVRGREIYWLSGKKPGESEISNAVFELAVGRQSALRGMKTMRELAKRFGPRG
jgi:uncharacterized protein (DUF1697 family)